MTDLELFHAAKTDGRVPASYRFCASHPYKPEDAPLAFYRPAFAYNGENQLARIWIDGERDRVWRE